MRYTTKMKIKLHRIHELWAINNSGIVLDNLKGFTMFANNVMRVLSSVEQDIYTAKIYQITDNDQTVYIIRTKDQVSVTSVVPKWLVLAQLSATLVTTTKFYAEYTVPEMINEYQ